MKKILFYFVFFCIHTFANTISQEKIDEFGLTQSEVAYLNDKKEFSAQNETAWDPFNFQYNNKPIGYSIDYMNLIAKKLGIKIKYIQNRSWNQYLQMSKNKKLDILLNVVKTDDRSEHLTFTSVYKTMNHILYSHKDNMYRSLNELQGKSIAVPKGFFQHELLQKLYPNIKLKLYDDILDCLKAVSFNQSDAAITLAPIAQKLIYKHALTNLKASGEIKYPLKNSDAVQLRIASHKDNQILISILQKVMNTITYEEILKLDEKWLSWLELQNQTLNLTAKETLFLQQNPVIKVHNEQGWAPFNFNENNQPKGFSIDYMKLLAKKAGFKVEFISGPTWNEFLDMTKSGELDVMLNIVQTPQREKFLNFTDKSYISTTRAIIKRKDDDSIQSFSDLSHKTVAIEKGFFYQEYLKKIDPTINLLPLANTQETLYAVSTGQADATIGVLPVELYLIDRYFLTNLTHILDPKVEILKAYGQKIGVRKGMDELVTILNKAVNSVTYQELSLINSKWFGYNDNKENKINFSREEELYIKNNPYVNVSFMRDFFPFSFLSNEKPVGMSHDILEKISFYSGLKFNYKPYVWSESLKNFKNKKTQIIDSISFKKDRTNFTYYTKPYHEIPIVIFTTRKNLKFDSLKVLYGKTVGVTKNEFYLDELKKLHPQIKIKEYKTVSQRMQDLAYGKIDFAISSFVTGNDAISKFGLSNINVLGELKLQSIKKEDLRYGIDKSNPILFSIFNKTYEYVHNHDLIHIQNNWMGADKKQSIKKTTENFLTIEEKEFLEKHKYNFNLCVDTNNLPYAKYNNDFQGFFADITKEIEKNTDISFNHITVNGQKAHILNVLQNECSLSLSVTNRYKIIKDLYYSEPFWESKIVIVTNEKHPFVENINEFKDKKIGYILGEEGFSYMKNIPSQNMVGYNSLEDLLVALAAEKIDAYIGSLARVSYNIKKLGILNLKIAAITQESIKHVAIFNKDMGLLHGIINKSLKQINEKQKNAIRSKWVNVEVEKYIKQETLYQIAFVIFIIIGAIVFRHIQLRKLNITIEKKNKDLQNALDELTQTQRKLIESEKSAALGNIVSGVAHEINTPLGVAYTTVTALQTIEKKLISKLAKSEDEELQKYSKKLDQGFVMIEHNLKRAAELIQSFKRISVSQHVDNLASIKLENFMHDLTKSLKYEYKKYGHTITIDKNHNISLSTYPGSLAQVMTNLIMNSLKHGFKNQKNKHITIKFINTNNGVNIHYLDDGIGISTDIADKIYDPFFTTDRQDGTGLGMHLVYNLTTQKLKGEIKLLSKGNKGVHFVLYIPNQRQNKS